MTSSDRFNSILIVLSGSLGDVMRGLSIVSPLKKKFPEANITWLIDEKWKEIVNLHPEIDQLRVFERSKGMSAFFSLRKQLKQDSYDLCLDMQRILKSGLFSWWSGARLRLGFNPKDCKEFNWVWNNAYVPFFGNENSKLDHYLTFLDYLDVPWQEPLSFGLERVEPESFPRKQVFGILLGSSWESKDWFTASYAQLCKELVTEFDASVVLIGDKSQTSISNQILEEVQSENLINLTGKTSLKELVSIIKGFTLCVGPDSGPGHIAAAVGTPYIALFGPTPPKRVAPYGNQQNVIKASLDCMPCYKRNCPGLNQICMRSITPEMVLARIRELLAELPSHSAHSLLQA